MPEQRIVMDLRVWTCVICHGVGERRVGEAYDITITKPDSFSEGEDVPLADDQMILCDEHAKPVQVLIGLLDQFATPDGGPEVITIRSMEDLMRLQPAPALDPAKSEPEVSRSGHQPDSPPPAAVVVVEELPTQQAKIRCLEEGCGAELLYNGIGPHKRSKHPNVKELDWEFIELPVGNPVYECRQPRSTGGRCKAKYTRLEEIIRHQSREKHVDPKWGILLRNRREEAAAKV